MKKMSKLIATLMALLMMTSCLMGSAIGEDIEVESVAAIADAEAQAEAEAAEQAAKEAAEQAAAEQAAKEAAEQTAAEQAAKEAAEQAATEPETKEGPEQEAVEETAPVQTAAPFTANVSIQLRNTGDIFEGDTVRLDAMISGANMGYTAAWQSRELPTDADKDPAWNQIAAGETCALTMSQEAAKLEYRVLLTADNGETVSSAEYRLPAPAVKTENVETAAETEETEESEESEETEEPEDAASAEEKTEPAPEREETNAEEPEAPAAAAEEKAETRDRIVTAEVTIAVEEVILPEITVETEEAAEEAEEIVFEDADQDEETIEIEDNETPLAIGAFSYEYERENDGSLILDEAGNPIAILEADQEIPKTWLRDEEGSLMLDQKGNPVATQTVPADAVYVQTLRDQLDPNRSIDIYVTFENDHAILGNTASFVAVLNGYDSLIYTLQWQQSDDGVNWFDLTAAQNARLEVETSEANMHDYWRVEVTITSVKG